MRRGRGMGLIERLISAVAKLAPRYRDEIVVEVNDAGIFVTSGEDCIVFGWTEIDRIVAVGETRLASNLLVLIFEFSDARRMVVDEMNPGWPSLIGEIARRLPTAAPAASWQLQLMAEPASRVEVYHRR